MENLLRKLTKMRQAGEWKLNSLDPLRYEAASIYDGICPTRGPSLNDNFAAFKKALEAYAKARAMDAAGSPHEPSVFLEVFEKLPVIVERIKALPEGGVREVRMIQKSEVKALDAFIEACEVGILWARIGELTPLLNSGEADEVIASKAGCSRDWVKQVRKKWAKDRKPLEAAMFLRFTQAYKWWQAEDKAESAFFDLLRTT